MPTPIEQLLSHLNPPALRPLVGYDANKVIRGGQQLSTPQFNAAAQSILAKKPVFHQGNDHGILSDIVGLPGNFLRDATETAQGVFSPWKWIPSIYHNVTQGNFNGLLPLIPGYTTVNSLVHGDFHQILTHPVGTTLDVLPYAHGLLPHLGNALYGDAIKGAVPPEVSNVANAAEDVTKTLHPDTPTTPTPRTMPIEEAMQGGTVAPHLLERTGIEDRPAIDALKADIAQNGIQQPLDFLHRNGQNILWDGNHRLIAANELGIKEIPYRMVNEAGEEVPHPTITPPPETTLPNPEVRPGSELGRVLTPRQNRIAAAMAEGKPGRTLFQMLPEAINNPEEGIIGQRLTNLAQRAGINRAMAQANRGFQNTALSEYAIPLQEAFKDFTPEERKGFVQWMNNFDENNPHAWTDVNGVEHPVPQKFHDVLPKFNEIAQNVENAARDHLTKVWANGRQEVYHNASPVLAAQEDNAKADARLADANAGAIAARDAWLKHQMEEVTPTTPVTTSRVLEPGSKATFAAGEEGVVPVEPRKPVYSSLPRKSARLFRIQDRIEALQSRIDNLHVERRFANNGEEFAAKTQQIDNALHKLNQLKSEHEVLSQREMLVHNLQARLPHPLSPLEHVSPEDYHLLDTKIPGEPVSPGKAYRKALEELDAAKANVGDVRTNFEKVLHANAPATYYPRIQDEVLKRIVDKVREENPHFLEGSANFNWETTQAALDKELKGRTPVEAKLVTPKELTDLTREVESTWQQLADEGLHPQYLSSVPASRFNSVLDPNLFRAGAIKDEPYAVMARTRDITPSGVQDPVIGLTAPAMAILRRNSLQEFYNTHLAPLLKTESDLHTWLDDQIAQGEFKPLGPGETFMDRRNAIKASRWSAFDRENIDPELAQFFPKGEQIFLPKEINDTVHQMFSPKSDRLESVSQANIHGMRIFRTAVMGLSAKHLAHILFGGLSMLLLRGGMEELSPARIQAAWQMVKDDVMPKELSAGVDFYSGKQLAAGNMPAAEATNAAQRIGGTLSRGLTRVQKFEERISNFERSLSYLAEHDRIMAEKGSPHLSTIENADVKAALEAGNTEHALELAKQGAITHANKALIDFDGMLPAERGIVRNIFPFYAFTRHIFKYALTYPIDYPLRASFVYRMGQIVQNDMQNQGLPEQWMRYLTFGPDKEGNVTNVDLRFLNPFRSLPDDATGAGLVNTLNPFLGYAMEWAGVNPWTTSPQRFPDIRYNPATGYVETKRKPFSLLGLVSSIIPEAGAIGQLTGGNPGETNPQGISNQLSRYAFIPGLPHHANVNLQRATDTLGQFEVAQGVVSNALRTGDTSKLRDWNLVPVPGQSRLVPGALLAKIIENLPKSKQSPRQQLGVR